MGIQPTTAAAIRDRAIVVIEGLVPGTIADRFRRYNNEGTADFKKWAAAIGDGAFRRFQVRTAGINPTPAVSNTDVEERLVKLLVLVAYPQTARTGAKEALDRDTAMDQDQNQILHAIGMAGRPNFSASNGYPDACCRVEDVPERIETDGVDFLSFAITLGYQRVMT